MSEVLILIEALQVISCLAALYAIWVYFTDDDDDGGGEEVPIEPEPDWGWWARNTTPEPRERELV